MQSKLIEVRESAGGMSTFIKGTRVRVSDVVRMSSLGETAAEIQSALPHLTIHQVQAAISYWKTHLKAIETEIEEEETLLTKMQPKL